MVPSNLCTSNPPFDSLSGLSRSIYSKDAEARGLLLRDTNAYLLYEQSKAVVATFEVHNEEEATDSESSSGEDISATDFETHLSELRISVSGLTDLSSALQYPAEDPEEPIEATRNLPQIDRTPSQYYTELIITKYPKVSIELAGCLGTANWLRYQRLQAVKAQAAQTGGFVADTTPLPKGHSEFMDSGLGSSIPAQATLYTETIASFKSSVAGGYRAHIPPLPVEAKSGKRFECVACGNSITANNTRVWR